MLKLFAKGFTVKTINYLVNKVDQMSDNDFFIFLFLLCSSFWVITTIFSIRQSNKELNEIINKSKKMRIRCETLYQSVLEKEANTQQIYLYFVENKFNKLPDSLHNIMLANAINNDYYSVCYVRSLDQRNSMRPKIRSFGH